MRCDNGFTLHFPKKGGWHDVVTVPFHCPLSSFRELRVPSSCSTVTFRSPELYHGASAVFMETEISLQWQKLGILNEMATWTCEVWGILQMNYDGTAGLETFSLVAKDKRGLSPHPEASKSSADEFRILSLGGCFQVVWQQAVPVATKLLDFHRELLLQNSICNPVGSRPTADPWHSRDGWDVSAQQRQLGLDFLSISSCMHVFAITRWWDFWALVFQVHWYAEFQRNCTKWFLGHRTKVPYKPSTAYFSYLL